MNNCSPPTATVTTSSALEPFTGFHIKHLIYR